MFLVVTFISLLIQLTYENHILRTCVPNTQFLLNGRLCYCNSMGQWSDAACQMISRRRACTPGQIIWEECSQCICQENEKLLCSNTDCTDEGAMKFSNKTQLTTEMWCTPFRSYYINCSLCVCPASGKMSDARCANDSSCVMKGPNVSIEAIQHNVCIPKVMYLFTCVHCLCSDKGTFIRNKCVETCQKSPQSAVKCIPNTFYRLNCNIYRCPKTGITDENLRTKDVCNKPGDVLGSLDALRNISVTCQPNKFTKPKCIYCECSAKGGVNDTSCFEQECLKIEDYAYDHVKSSCHPGEIVPTCMECLCPHTGITDVKYCTRVCSFQNRLIMVEHALKEIISPIHRDTVKNNYHRDTCEPNTVFIVQGKFCLCPENGNAELKLCTSVTDDTGHKLTHRVLVATAGIDFNITCEANTFVEFNCNTCYCNKQGKIDKEWCTFDDCESKQLIKNTHVDKNSGRMNSLSSGNLLVSCIPGAISKVDCNYCICSKSGLIKDRSCTNNTCSGRQKPANDEFACEPSAYYTVDCNICFCGLDGIKNLDKCTKNQCEASFLRTDACSPGELFSDDCNICVCPPNGDKKDKACTNRTCTESDTPWKKIFKLSQNLLGNHVQEESTKNLEHCFPGEEFVTGCKLCVCPEMGLREYAPCTAMLCDKESTSTVSKGLLLDEID